MKRYLPSIKGCSSFAAVLLIAATPLLSQDFIEYQGTPGLPGNGKNIVLVSGDEEYGSEEALPMLGKILAGRHGFHCRVVFAIDPQSGQINPNVLTHIPGLEALDSADLMVMFIRFRNLPDDQMKHIVDYTNSGKPIIGMRTATHAFQYDGGSVSPYKKYSVNDPSGGYGKTVFGETWVAHHAAHGAQSTRGVIADAALQHPAMTGVHDLWGPTDVYAVNALPQNTLTLVNGQVLNGMNPDDAVVEDKGLTPVIWTRRYAGDTGDTSTVMMSTLASAIDFENEGLRRVIINSAYWMTGLAGFITDSLNVDIVDAPYTPRFFAFNGFVQGLVPADYAMREVFEPVAVYTQTSGGFFDLLPDNVYNTLGQRLDERNPQISIKKYGYTSSSE